MARDFLIPVAGAVVLALILTPAANTLERFRLPPSPAAAVSVILLSLGMAILLAVTIPALRNWLDQTPFLTYRMDRKLEGLRKSLTIVQEISKQVEQATTAATNPATQTAPQRENVVVRDKSLLGEVVSTTPRVLLQIGFASVLAFVLLAHRNSHRRQILRKARPRHYLIASRRSRLRRQIGLHVR